MNAEQALRLDMSFLTALHSAKPVGGLTHGFYLYPARFPPEVARSIITRFSQPGDWVLDPFMGGGTSIVEGLAQGRKMMGADVNALSHFVASVRTTPLSPADEFILKDWATEVSALLARDASWVERGSRPSMKPNGSAATLGSWQSTFVGGLTASSPS